MYIHIYVYILYIYICTYIYIYIYKKINQRKKTKLYLTFWLEILTLSFPIAASTMIDI